MKFSILSFHIILILIFLLYHLKTKYPSPIRFSSFCSLLFFFLFFFFFVLSFITFLYSLKSHPLFICWFIFTKKKITKNLYRFIIIIPPFKSFSFEEEKKREVCWKKKISKKRLSN